MSRKLDCNGAREYPKPLLIRVVLSSVGNGPKAFISRAPEHVEPAEAIVSLSLAGVFTAGAFDRMFGDAHMNAMAVYVPRRTTADGFISCNLGVGCLLRSSACDNPGDGLEVLLAGLTYRL
jgi:hypothetical protein